MTCPWECFLVAFINGRVVVMQFVKEDFHMVSTPSWCNLLLKCVILPAIVEYQLVEATRQVFMSFVELQKLGTMFLKDITGGSHYLFEEVFTDDKQYPSAEFSSTFVPKDATELAFLLKITNFSSEFETVVRELKSLSVSANVEVDFASREKTEILDSARNLFLQCDFAISQEITRKKSLWLTNDVGLLLLAFLYKSVLTTASTRTLRFHVSAFSVIVGDYTSKRATIATLWVAKSCYAELVKGFSIPPALYHKHHRGCALSSTQQIAQLTPISRLCFGNTDG
ncbi:hypothetical protein ACLB2K_022954 [Fragaria x ananassa]